LKILIASDHAGFELKEYLKKKLTQYFFEDLGPSSESRVDYPDFAKKVCEKIKPEDTNQNPTQFGVLICGSGQGMAMTANKYPHIRAALCWDHTTARLSREHNNANILCLGGRLIPFSLACEIFEIFMKTEFAKGRHSDRVKKIKT